MKIGIHRSEARKFMGSLSDALPLHDQTICPRKTNIKKGQKGLLGFIPVDSTSFGEMYEKISCAIYGAKMVPKGEYSGVDPDVKGKGFLMECKASSVNHDAPLRIKQLNGYLSLKDSNPNDSISYSYYVHCLSGMRDYNGSLEELAEGVSQNTLGSFVLPVELLKGIKDYAINGGNGLIRYIGGKRSEFGECIYIKTEGVRLLFDDPQKFVAHFNLDPKDFEYQRLILSKPINLCGNVMNPFPILKINYLPF